MHPRKFAMIAGALMVAIGVAALIPNWVGTTENLPRLYVETSYGYFLGLFPMNVFNKVALIVIGLAGIGAATSRFTDLPRSIAFSRFVMWFMGAAAILGMIPPTETLFGYWPLFGAEVILHAAFAAVGGYFGYTLSANVPDSGPAITDFRAPLQSKP